MARPRTIKGSGPSVPTGPFRVSPEQRAALETWARRRQLLDKHGEPELGAAFRDLLDLAGAIIECDRRSEIEAFVVNVLEEGFEGAPGDEDVDDSFRALVALVATRTPPSHSATPAEPTPRTESPK